MGSEQSTQNTDSAQGRTSRTGQLRRGKSVPEQKRSDAETVDASRPGSISPGPSICSDSDLPYISYTVNRPIGDSPKPSKQTSHLTRGKSLGTASSLLSSPGGKRSLLRKQSSSRIQSSTGHNIVVVNKPTTPQDSSDKDADILKLQSVPMFLPIMRGTLNLTDVRDPEVLERLDQSAVYKLCLRYQNHLNHCATVVADEQNVVCQKMREVDLETNRLVQVMTERQKIFTKYTEKLNKVHEITHQLNKCHLALNQTLELIETLNNTLPADERLEPFVWTTG
ncbi:BLOC-1 related complex subunit 5 [Lycorma delicatula]|uniref:BLOC-1 related complex subunit 5 n=1 Tax=Lycorma delicatula TaxID=130591 RepID=UPI003F514CF6